MVVGEVESANDRSDLETMDCLEVVRIVGRKSSHTDYFVTPFITYICFRAHRKRWTDKREGSY